jgi:hypothetical protein
MASQQVILLIINVIGGAAVVGSYAHGLITHPRSGLALWGGTPESIRPFYGVSMVLAALGYFAFSYFILFRLVPADTHIAGRFGFRLFYAIFLGILAPSVLWMPFTYAYIGNPTTGMWTGIRLVLILVGLSSGALVWALLNLDTKEPVFPYWLAVAGSGYFAFHTAILDMLLWPILFRM